MICIICEEGTRRLGESWLEKMSQWIHISAATDWTWSFPNEARGHMKSLHDDELERRDNVDERQEKRMKGAGERCYPVLISQRLQIKACWIFNVEKESFQSIYYILLSRRAAHHGFHVIFIRLFYFHKVFVSPKQVQVFTPVKRVHTARHEDTKFHGGY